MRNDKKLIACAAVLAAAVVHGAERPVEVWVRQTPQGPRIFVDGVAVRPRFYYGSAPCLCSISEVRKLDYTIPFRPEEDTDRGRVSLDGFDDDEPMWFSEAKLIDKTAGTTVRLSSGGEERARPRRRAALTRAANFRAQSLFFQKRNLAI